MDIKKNRLAFLDFLRFIAAFSVLGEHVFERLFPAFIHFTTHYFQLGLFGVILFFLTSGFIIPVSLEKGASLKTFWVSRIFRLYPLYIVSIITVLLGIHFGLYKVSFPSLKTIITNLFMFQLFLGQPNILGLYWTLCLELFFYFVVSIIFALGFIKKSVFIASVFLGISFVAGVIAIGYFHLASNGWGLIFYLSTMFMGTLFYRLVNNEISFSTFIIMIILAAAVLLSNTFINLYGHDKPELLGARSFLPVTTAIIGAYLVFFAVVIRCQKFNFPKVFVFFGVMSYSIYLVQGIILTLIPESSNALVFTFTRIGLTISISLVTYHFVEKPFIRFGKKLSESIKNNRDKKLLAEEKVLSKEF
ncbi:acyltransferase [Mucilaginibacter sp.]|uniref:acyltransferase family protein n=1 Tax=Mucilaginibacter sp. TaxID=1882438 RepID=UPI0025E36210|nr:acyltransferase [Mucilaginibacter sp.]